ncbi:MAG TPA: PilZ domain-containing protein [Anaeromyxobacter sp.]|nr:PilZ domain-containing protein [Anaeromyxobacter sp.]
MLEYAENPRRTPRLPLRCRARLELPTGDVETVTEDIGARGCQVVLPVAIDRGQPLRLLLDAPRTSSTLRVDGRAAWVSPRAPWRVGIAFLPEELSAAARWMEELRRGTPGLASARQAPERVSLSALFYLGPVPRLLDLGDEDLAMLGRVGHGLRLSELKASAARDWPGVRRRFFALLEQGYLTLSRAAAVHPRAWTAVLGEPAPTPIPSLPTVSLTSPGQPGRSGTPFPSPTRRATDPAPTPPPASPAPVPETSRAPAEASAGAAWRAPATARSPEADALFRLAMSEIEAGRAHQALALLRRALGLAPGDPEIAGAIGRAMRVGRS